MTSSRSVLSLIPGKIILVPGTVARVSEILVEGSLVPGMVELLHRLGVIEVLQGGRFAADDPEQARSDLVFPGLVSVAQRALLERRFAGFDVGGYGRTRSHRGENAEDENCPWKPHASSVRRDRPQAASIAANYILDNRRGSCRRRSQVP